MAYTYNTMYEGKVVYIVNTGNVVYTANIIYIVYIV